MRKIDVNLKSVSKDMDIPNEKRKGFGYYASKAIIGVSVCLVAAGSFSAIDVYVNNRHNESIKRNNLGWKTNVAKEHIGDDYMRLAYEAVDRCPGLEEVFKMDEIRNRIGLKNDGKDIMSGDEYETYSCD